MNVVIQQWKDRDKLFVNTNVYKALIKSVKTDRVAIVTGSPGCGKSYTAQHALLTLKKDGYDVIPVTSSSDMVRYFCGKNRQVFYIDDLCGKHSISNYNIEEWGRNKIMLSYIFSSPLTKCIFTCRLQILKDPNFVNLNLSKVKVFNLSSDYKLTLKEKRSVGEKYLPKDILKSLGDKTICYSECFPLLCSMYSKYSHESTLFFEKPKTYFETELDELKKEPYKLKYACIALCVMFNDKVFKSIFKHLSDVSITERVKVSLEECEVIPCAPRKTILSQFHSMVGTYFKESETGFTSIHDYMFDIYCSHVGKFMLQCIVEHADSKLISDRAVLESVVTDNHQFTFVIPKTIEIIFFKRIVEDLKNNKIWDVFSSRQMKFAEYRSKIATFLHRHHQILNNTDENGMSGLYVSSQNGYIDIVDILCINGGNINKCTKDGCTPLFAAAFYGHKPCVDMLLYRGAEVNASNIEDFTPLYVATQEGHTDIVDLICLKGGNVYQCAKRGCSPLHMASGKGHSDIVALLCNKGANVNQCTQEGKAPLHAAAQEGYINILHLLCIKGGDVNKSDNNGYTPLHIASIYGHKACVDVLIKRGADVNLCNTNGESPLYRAAQEGHADVVDLLCREGGNVNQRCRDECTPLHIASFCGETKCVEMLIKRGANVNAFNNNGATSLYRASQEGYIDIVELLCNKGGNINQVKNDGQTPLFIASCKGHSNIVELLCNRGGNINQCCIAGRSPLYIALVFGRKKCVDVLINRGAVVKP